MQITKHFSLAEMTRSEAATRHGISNECPPDLIPNITRVATALEKIREYFDRPIHVTSCYRSPEVNNLVGGSRTSAHKLGMAADFEVQGIANITVCEVVATLIKDYDQIIYEFGSVKNPFEGWVHLGFANIPRHQRLSAKKIDGHTQYLSGFINV